MRYLKNTLYKKGKSNGQHTAKIRIKYNKYHQREIKQRYRSSGCKAEISSHKELVENSQSRCIITEINNSMVQEYNICKNEISELEDQVEKLSLKLRRSITLKEYGRQVKSQAARNKNDNIHFNKNSRRVG